MTTLNHDDNSQKCDKSHIGNWYYSIETNNSLWLWFSVWTGIFVAKLAKSSIKWDFFKLFKKPNFCPIIHFFQNPNIFTSFLPKIVWQFFLWNQSCQQLKSKITTFSRVFHPQKIDNFLGKSKLNFLTVCLCTNFKHGAAFL